MFLAEAREPVSEIPNVAKTHASQVLSSVVVETPSRQPHPEIFVPPSQTKPYLRAWSDTKTSRNHRARDQSRKAEAAQSSQCVLRPSSGEIAQIGGRAKDAQDSYGPWLKRQQAGQGKALQVRQQEAQLQSEETKGLLGQGARTARESNLPIPSLYKLSEEIRNADSWKMWTSQ